ncbi:extracellular solute-binding protein [Paenarthrobacter nitroguajacolicus]|uniref:extracellular solute-binding protein n=1 Tax=Paenarthrobacter nitroguajacolicus TaxID=211146 RepID=UPI002860FF90|nr:extracellular solute-binding protein [Paenarthrobacter nitroguajacolicus]MDR6637764.1 raffinose/stachyose/melibiose transport system substrate-binding protein [Paenarthrobacter nitroguajacolicus]
MNNLKLRTAGMAVSAAVLSISLAACGSSGPAGTGASADSATMWGLTGGDQPVFQASVDSWNKAHPDSSIKLDFFANDAYKTKVRTAVGAGQGPTLVYGWGGGVLKSYVDAGQVDDLTGFLKENPDVQSRYLPSILESGVIDGKTYALPNNKVQPVVLYYNKEVFDKIGAEAPKTWDELMALVPKFKAAGVAPFSLGGQSKWPDLMWLEYLVDRIGGPEVFAKIAANKPDAWSDPAVIEALTKIQELVDAGGFINGFSSIAADSNADQALLYTGKAAMILQGSWIYQGMKKDAADFVKSGKLGYTPFPTIEGGKGDPANVVGNPSNFWSVSSKATEEQKKTALDYVKDGMFNDENVKALIDSGAVPVVTGIEDKLAASPDKDFLTYVYGMAKDAPDFTLSWDQALSPAQGDAMLANLDQIFLKKITPEQFASTMNATIGK